MSVPGLEVGGLAHVEHGAGGVGEPVDAGTVGEPGGEAQLGGVGVTDQPGKVEQLIEAEDAVRAGPLEQGVEEIPGGQHVVEGPVRRLVREPEGGGQGAELAVGHHVPDQPRASARVSTVGLARGSRPVATRAWSRKETSNRRLWPTSTAPPTNSRKEGSISPDPRGVGHHGVADAGEGGDERRDPPVGPHEGLVGAEELATPVAGRRHLGEGGVRRGAPGGLHVDDHERHLAEWSPEVVEGPQCRNVHASSVANTCSIPWVLVGSSGAGTVGRWTALRRRRPRRAAPRPAAEGCSRRGFARADPVPLSASCGESRRFDVVSTRRTKAFHHYSVGGEPREEEEVLRRGSSRYVPLVGDGGVVETIESAPTTAT